MADYVRIVKLRNASGGEIDCLLKSSFFNDLAGLGYEDDTSYISYDNGFYTPYDTKLAQGSISGTMSFITRAYAYQNYRTLTNWISAAEYGGNVIKICYTPYYGSYEYVKNVKFKSITKGELDTAGYLSCNVVFDSLTPWYLQDAVQYTFNFDTDTAKVYSYNYSQIYGDDGGSVTFSLTGDLPGRFRLTIPGEFSNPAIYLYDADNSDALIGQMVLNNTTILTGRSLVFSTVPGEVGVYRLTNLGVKTDLIDRVTMTSAVPMFFTLPLNKNLKYRFTATGTGTTNAVLEVFKYYKTR